jgi:hypothetical protein
MKTVKSNNQNLAGRKPNKEEANLPGYPTYPEDEDIYRIDEEEMNIDPEDIHRTKELNQTGLDNDYSDDDLDIPGSELDDEMENIGSEDEENNYYSIGGDDHDDLDENQGE